MKRLFEAADIYLRQSDWRDLALIKFCLFAMGLLCGMQIGKKAKKPAGIVAVIVFLATYIPLMAKFFSVFKETDPDRRLYD